MPMWHKLGFPCQHCLPQCCDDDTWLTLSREDCLETFSKGPDITCQKDMGELEEIEDHIT